MTSTEPGTGAFPTMGTSAAQLAHVAKPERGRSRPRKGGMSGQGDLAHKSNRSMAYERMGASLHPVMKMSEPNSTEPAKTGQHVLKMPSRGSWTDSFRAKAKYGRSF
jgi:hypothetical protein